MIWVNHLQELVAAYLCTHGLANVASRITLLQGRRFPNDSVPSLVATESNPVFVKDVVEKG